MMLPNDFGLNEPRKSTASGLCVSSRNGQEKHKSMIYTTEILATSANNRLSLTTQATTDKKVKKGVDKQPPLWYNTVKR